jgi:hypothetical protein
LENLSRYRSWKNSEEAGCAYYKQHDRDRHISRPHGIVSVIPSFQSLQNSGVLNDRSNQASMPRQINLLPKISVLRMGSTESWISQAGFDWAALRLILPSAHSPDPPSVISPPR